MVSANGVEPQPLRPDQFIKGAKHLLKQGYYPLPVGVRTERRSTGAVNWKAPWLPNFNGYKREIATEADVLSWPDEVAEKQAKGLPGVLSLGIVLPANVIAVDVDHYDDKHGLTTLAQWAQEFGAELPATWTITARPGGSGIRLYRKHSLDYYPKEIKGSDIEFLDSNHRYAMAPGSWHHTGARYELFDPEGNPCRKLPLPDDLPLFPSRYESGLPSNPFGHEAGTSADVEDFLTKHTAAMRPGTIQGVITKWNNTLASDGPHEALKQSADMGFNDAAAGLLNAKTVYDTVRELWCETGRGRTEFDDYIKWQVVRSESLDKNLTATKAGRDYDKPMSTTESNDDSWADDVDPTEPDEREIEKLQKRSREQREAKARESRLAWVDPPEQGSAFEQSKVQPPEVDWVIKGILLPKARIMINAQAKTGKTTLGINLMRSILTGEDFLRKFPMVAKPFEAVAYWNHEVDQFLFNGWLQDRGLLNEEYGSKIYPLHTRDFNARLDLMNPVTAQWAVKWLKDKGIDFWFIDTFARLYKGKENDNDLLGLWWETMLEIAADAGVKNVVVFHHTGYSEDAQDRSRGGSVLSANPDANFSFRHAGKPGEMPPNNYRWLRGFGRHVDLAEVQLDYSGDGQRELFVTESNQIRSAELNLTDKMVEVANYLHAHCKTEPITFGALCTSLNMAAKGRMKARTDAILSAVVLKGWGSVTKKGNAFQYTAGSKAPGTIEGSGTIQ